MGRTVVVIDSTALMGGQLEYISLCEMLSRYNVVQHSKLSGTDTCQNALQIMWIINCSICEI